MSILDKKERDMATAAETPLDRLEQARERLAALDTEQVGIPAQVRAALVEGDDREYRRLTDRQGAIPRERFAAQVRALREELEYKKEQLAEIAPQIGPAHARFQEAEAALQAATEERNRRLDAWGSLREEQRELQSEVRQIERHRMPALLAQASRGR